MIEQEKQLIDEFRRFDFSTEPVCNTLEEKMLYQIIKDKNFWNDWFDTSAHNAPPPDFYSDKYKMMMDVMKVEDNSRKTKSGKLRNPKAEEEKKIYNLLKQFGIFQLDDVYPKIIVRTGLPTKEDHRFEWYYNNFKRVLSEHNKKIPLYKKNHKGYSTIFFVFDESTAYVQMYAGQNYTNLQIGQKINGILHYAVDDEAFQDVIKSTEADYIIWFMPYKNYMGYETMESQPLPKVAIIDIKALKQGKISCTHYIHSLMISAEA